MDVPMSMALFSAAYSAGNVVSHHTPTSEVIVQNGISLNDIIPICVAWGVGVAFCIALLVILTSR